MYQMIYIINAHEFWKKTLWQPLLWVLRNVTTKGTFYDFKLINHWSKLILQQTSSIKQCLNVSRHDKTAYKTGVHKSVRANKFCAVAPHICRPSVCNLVHVTVLAPSILMCLLGFFSVLKNLCTPVLNPCHNKNGNEILVGLAWLIRYDAHVYTRVTLNLLMCVNCELHHSLLTYHVTCDMGYKHKYAVNMTDDTSLPAWHLVQLTVSVWLAATSHQQTEIRAVSVGGSFRITAIWYAY
jgi:hypothetical protein